MWNLEDWENFPSPEAKGELWERNPHPGISSICSNIHSETMVCHKYGA